MMPKQLLLVEDNPDDVLLTMRALAQNKIANEVVVCSDGVEALDHLFDESKELPAVVLLDLNLPRLSGSDVLQRLRQNPRTALVPVVVLTTSRQESDLVRSYTQGANSYIVKPVDFEQFVEATRQIGMYWLLLNVDPMHPVR